jgi:hypothetical protein
MISRPVRALGQTSTVRGHGPWVVIGLVVVAAVWTKLITLPGELLQRDLEYPLVADYVLDDFYPMLASDGRSALGHMSLTPVMGLVGLLLEGIGGTSGAMIRGLVVGQSLAAFVSMYFLFQLVAERDATRVLPGRAGGLAAGLFYALNPWALARVEHLGLLIGYSLLPLVLGLALLAVRRRSARLAVGASLAFWFAAASPHYLVFTTAILAALALYYLIGARTWGAARLLIRLGAVGLTTIVGLEMFLVLPALSSSWLSGGLPAEISAGADDLAIGGGAVSWLEIVTLTSNAVWSDAMRPGGQAAWAWMLVALLPAGCLVWVSVFGRPRVRVGILLLALAMAVVAVEVLVAGEAGSGATGFVISRIPGGRALREPDKLSGLLALAFAWGVGGAVGMLVQSFKVPARRTGEGLVVVVLLGALVLAVTAMLAPAIRYFLWTEEVANWLPHSWPTGYERPLAALRDAEGVTRTVVFERDERVPIWDETRVLRQPVSRSLAGVPTVGWRHGGSSVFLSGLLQLDGADLVGAVRLTGADRLLVVHDTREGAELNERVARTGEFEVLVADEYATLYSSGEVFVGSGYAAGGWWPVYGLNGAASGAVGAEPALLVVADAGASGCPAELAALPMIGSTPVSGVLPPCASPDRLIQLRPELEEVGGWEATWGSAAGLSRWAGATGRQGLTVREYGYGLGFAWIEPGLPEGRNAIFPVGQIEVGAQLYLRALVGGPVAALEVEALDSSGTTLARTEVAADGEPRLEWVPIAIGEGGGSSRLRITAAEGFGAVNAVAVGSGTFGPGTMETVADVPPAVLVRRESRTRLKATVEGSSGAFALVVTENYSPVWRARYPGGEAMPFPAGYARMGFLIPAAGDFEITVDFVPQGWHDAGLIISGVALAGAVAYLLWPGAKRVIQPGRRARQTTEVP